MNSMLELCSPVNAPLVFDALKIDNPAAQARFCFQRAKALKHFGVLGGCDASWEWTVLGNQITDTNGDLIYDVNTGRASCPPDQMARAYAYPWILDDGYLVLQYYLEFHP
jgi:hypothetical protein